MTNYITEIPKVGVQLLEWQVTLHLYACTTVWRNACSCYLLTQNLVNLMILTEECYHIRHKFSKNTSADLSL